MKHTEKHLLKRARMFIRGLPLRLRAGKCGRRVSVRPMPSDGHSIIGSLPGDSGPFVAATRSGNTPAPAIGRLLSEFSLGGKIPSLIEPFGYGRVQRPV